MRLKAVTLLSEWMIQSPLKLQSSSIEQIKDRVKDKSFEIRKFVTEAIGKAYYKHISSVAFKLCADISNSTFKSIESFISLIPKDIWERFHSVPSYIINCWGYPEVDFKLQLLHILQEYILPKQLKSNDIDSVVPSNSQSSSLELEVVRTVSLLVCFSILTSNEKAILSGIIAYKCKIRNDLKTLLKLHQDLSKKPEPLRALGSKSTNNNKENASAESQLDVLFRRSKLNLLSDLPVVSDKFPANSNDFNKKCVQMLDKLHDTK